MMRDEREERRAFERVEAALTAVIVGFNAAREAERSVGALVLNISLGGMRLESEEPFDLGECVEVSVQLPDGQGVLDAQAVIEACEAIPGATALRARFVELPSETFWRIARWTLAESKRANADPHRGNAVRVARTT